VKWKPRDVTLVKLKMSHSRWEMYLCAIVTVFIGTVIVTFSVWSNLTVMKLDIVINNWLVEISVISTVITNFIVCLTDRYYTLV
jgi:hypothetical protein